MGGTHGYIQLQVRSGNKQNDATRFGWGNRTPFLTRVLPGGGIGDDNWQGSYLSSWPENVLMVSAIPSEDGKSALIHVRETAGKEAQLKLINSTTRKAINYVRVDVTDTELRNGQNLIKPYESVFYRVEF
jgi:alpha-mannosidase